MSGPYTSLYDYSQFAICYYTCEHHCTDYHVFPTCELWVMRLVEGQVEEEGPPRRRALRHELLRPRVDLLAQGREVHGLRNK